MTKRIVPSFSSDQYLSANPDYWPDVPPSSIIIIRNGHESCRWHFFPDMYNVVTQINFI